jgi:hypothetical protein
VLRGGFNHGRSVGVLEFDHQSEWQEGWPWVFVVGVVARDVVAVVLFWAALNVFFFFGWACCVHVLGCSSLTHRATRLAFSTSVALANQSCCWAVVGTHREMWRDVGHMKQVW